MNKRAVPSPIYDSVDLHASIHLTAFEYRYNSSQVNSIAEFVLPQAGKTVVKRFIDTSKYTFKTFRQKKITYRIGYF